MSTVVARMSRAWVAAAVLLGGCGLSHPAPLVAVDQHPGRPALPARADTNDPRAYYDFGRARLGSAPDSAAAAFWWAARLEPWWAEPVYARAVALLASRNYSFRARALGNRPEPERDAYVMGAVDSLMRRAATLDPFQKHDLDYVITGRMPVAAIPHIHDPAEAGYVAFIDGEYEQATTLLGKALAKHPGEAPVRYIRAQAFYQLARYDSAAGELTRALDTLSARDTSRRILGAYHSKELLYFALGTVHAMRRDTAAARAAFEQALVENLGFAMARVRLASLALAAADTAGALRELDAALLAAPDDPALHFYYGTLLSSVGHTKDALDHLIRAVTLDVDYAAPHEMLGRIAEAIGERDEAADEYASFLRLAPAHADARPWVAQRLAALRPSP